jgi:eukaryotic-like serine/threonine-protein kinase
MSLASGTRIGVYEIVAPLGAGGMGEVYRARDPRLNRSIALKILPEEMAADPERRKRFEHEAQSVAALNHPNIVTVHSVEEAGGVLFMTMELVEGKPLSDLIAHGALPLEQILAFAVPLIDAVSAAHTQGITHRDLKPANVMVTPAGRVKVLDFGLAKLIEPPASETDATRLRATTLTEEGHVVGTVAYMSPDTTSCSRSISAPGRPGRSPTQPTTRQVRSTLRMAAGLRTRQTQTTPHSSGVSQPKVERRSR